MEKKYKFLPQVNAEKGLEITEKIVGKYPCPCCSNITFPVPEKEAVAYICPVCYWENDVFILNDDEPSDENHGISLNAARDNYKRFGACCESMIRYVRKPTSEEKTDK